MGELVLAAKVSHVPSIYLGEQPGPNHGIRASLREGLRRLGERARETGVETFVVFDVHWINTIGFHINSAQQHRGVFTSHELPHFIHDLPYDYRGDKALAELIADEVNGGGLRMMAHDLDTLTLEYATLLPMRYMNPAGGARVVPIGSNSNASMEENRRVGEAVRRAIERADRRVGVLASGSLSHAFWANERSSLPGALSQVSSDFNRQNDLHVLDLWKSGRIEEFLRFLPTYLKVCEGEINMADTAALFGVLGWDAYRGEGVQYGDYEGSSGTGQAIVEFPGIAATRWSLNRVELTRQERRQMGARTGAEYLAGLRAATPEIWIGGERVQNVVDHPAFRHGARSLARLYDMQHQPGLVEEMTYVSPTTRERVGMSFLTPRNSDDLVKRRRMMSRWAEQTGGMMGRTPDYLNSSLMAFAGAAPYFGDADPRFAENVRRYYEYVREHDLCLTHTLINPQSNRGVGPAGQADPYLAAAIADETDAGLVIRGARMLATLAPLADEIAVFPSTVLKGQPEERPYAFAFAISCDTPGLRFICRDSYDIGKPVFDHPLASRFEEMDCVVIFDDVLVPWERVFIHGDVAACNGAYGKTNAVVHMMHQVVTKNVAKSEYILGLASLMIDTIGVDQFQHVQEKVAEIITYLETMKACLRAAEADAAIDGWGVACPARMPLDVARNMFPKMYPRMIEILQLLGASGLMATPSLADLRSPIATDIDRFYQAAKANGRDRVRLFRLAWDTACSSFGSRQVLYERFFFGDPVRNMSALYNLYDKQPLMDRVQRFLELGD